MDKRKEIGENIALLIKSTGKSQAQVAREIGLGKNVITEYVAGNSYPSMSVFLKLCQVLDCSYEDILGRLE